MLLQAPRRAPPHPLRGAPAGVPGWVARAGQGKGSRLLERCIHRAGWKPGRRKQEGSHPLRKGWRPTADRDRLSETPPTSPAQAKLTWILWSCRLSLFWDSLANRFLKIYSNDISANKKQGGRGSYLQGLEKGGLSVSLFFFLNHKTSQSSSHGSQAAVN